MGISEFAKRNNSAQTLRLFNSEAHLLKPRKNNFTTIQTSVLLLVNISQMIITVLRRFL